MDVVEAACEAAELLSSAPIDWRFVEEGIVIGWIVEE